MTAHARHSGDRLSGVLYALGAYLWWGLMPLYFLPLRSVSAAETLAHRIVWSCILLAGLLWVTRRWGDLRACIADSRKLRMFLLSTLFIAINWLVYIESVNRNQVTQSSLGYFINPLLNVVFGMIFFRERLRNTQAAAIALALVGVGIMISEAGEIPWIAAILALSFGLYGTVRKAVPVDGFLGISIENLLLGPLALAFMTYLAATQKMAFAHSDRQRDWLLVSTGVVTTIPLIFFGQAAQRLRLSTLGFVQYLAPTMQFIIAVTVMGETVTQTRWIGFGFIWTALVVYTLDSIRAAHQAAKWRTRSTEERIGAEPVQCQTAACDN